MIRKLEEKNMKFKELPLGCLRKRHHRITNYFLIELTPEKPLKSSIPAHSPSFSSVTPIHNKLMTIRTISVQEPGPYPCFTPKIGVWRSK